MPTRQTALIVALLVVSAGAGGRWWWRAAQARGALDSCLAAGDRALATGDHVMARGRLAQAESLAPEDPRLGWLRGRIALHEKHYRQARKELAAALKACTDGGRPAGEQARVAHAYAEALAGDGETALAVAENDRAVAWLGPLAGRALEQRALKERKGLRVVARGPGGEPDEADVEGILALIEQTGRLAATLAGALRDEGRIAEAAKVITTASRRIGAALCPLEGAASCGDARADHYRRAMRPIREYDSALLRDRAVALVEAGRPDAALALLPEAAGRGPAGLHTDRGRRAARVTYAVRLERARMRERNKDWSGALREYAAAARLWRLWDGLPPPEQATANGPAPHLAPMRRAEVIAAERRAVEYIACCLAAGRARIAADPSDAEPYLAAALQDAERALDPRLPAGVRETLARRAPTWLAAARRIAPDDPAVPFHRGLLRRRLGRPGALRLLYRGVRNGYRTLESIDMLERAARASRGHLARRARRLVARLRKRVRFRHRVRSP